MVIITCAGWMGFTTVGTLRQFEDGCCSWAYEEGTAPDTKLCRCQWGWTRFRQWCDLPAGQACYKTVRGSCVGLRRSGSVVGLVAFQTEREEGRGLQHSSSILKSWLCKVGTYPYIQFGSVVCAGNLCTSKLLIQPELLSVLVIRKMCAHKFAYLKCSPLLRKDNKMRGQVSHSTR